MAKAIFRIPDELHRALKLEAVNRNVPMQELVRVAIEQTLAGVGPKSPRKAADAAQNLTEEEARLVNALLTFLRRQRGAVRVAGLRVLRAVLDDKSE